MLVIAPALEAASLYCRKLDADQFVGNLGTVNSITFSSGTRHMVIDVGGQYLLGFLKFYMTHNTQQPK